MESCGGARRRRPTADRATRGHGHTLAGLHAQKGCAWAFALFYIGNAFVNLQAAKKAFGLR